MRLKNLFPEDWVLLILGSLNAKKADRRLDRKAIIPMQAVCNGKIIPIDYFNYWGELGISSIAWNDRDPDTIYLTTGVDLISLDLKGKKLNDLNVSGLLDVHELTFFDDQIWLANTGKDEIVVFETDQKKVSNRIPLSIFEKKMKSDEKIEHDHLNQEFVDKFHCNQAFKGYDGNIYTLVHHVSGKQTIKMWKQRLIKSQGNGGVMNITTGKYFFLKLKAPHSIRMLHNQYWVLDSGHFTLNIYDTHWKLQKTLITSGWGRGADFSSENQYFYVGISAKRQRYLDLLPGKKQNPNMVQIFDSTSHQLKGEFVVPNVEQINNLYLVTMDQFKKLTRLNCTRHALSTKQ
jgi:hypothetical protein